MKRFSLASVLSVLLAVIGCGEVSGPDERSLGRSRIEPAPPTASENASVPLQPKASGGPAEPEDSSVSTSPTVETAPKVEAYRTPSSSPVADDIAAARLSASRFNSTGEFIDDHAEERFDDWLAAAEAGDADAQFLVARCYERGSGVEAEYSDAVTWLTRAVDQNHGLAINSLAIMHRDGRGVDYDEERANELLHRAAELGTPMAMYNLALGCEGERPRRIEDAIDWYRKASERGYFLGTARLLHRLEWGYARTTDEELAMLRRRAAEQYGEGGEAALASYFFAFDPVGNTVPDAEGTIDGERFRLAELRGKVVVLEFGATWCGPCRAMAPRLDDLADRYAEKPLRVLQVDTDENPGLSASWQVHGIPDVFVIGADGVVGYRGRSWSQIEETAAELVAAVASAD